VPREKAGAGSAVNNTVRQVAGALGVAILGSLLAVVFRNHLGSNAPAQLAARLDQPAAVVSKLPANEQVSTYVKRDASESIGGSLEYVGKAVGALQQRPGTPTPQQQAQAQQAIGDFVDNSKNSFMSAMRITSIVAGLFGLIGAIGAFLFLPNRREHAEHTADAPVPSSSGEPAMAH
jgi:DHA2 family integral membrane protein (MFS transporter)